MSDQQALDVGDKVKRGTAVRAGECPLGHSRVRTVERVPVADLFRSWHRQFGVSAKILIEADPRLSNLEFRECADCGLQFFFPSIAGDRDFYEGLSQSGWWGRDAIEYAKPEWEVALRHIEPGHTVLDVGCGGSRFDLRLPEGCVYVGLELNEKQASWVREKGVDVRLQSIQEHAEQNQARYDVVCLFQVIEHVDNLVPFLKATISCLKPGGALVVGCPNVDGFLRTEHDNLLNMPPHHVTWWSRRSLEHLSRDIGMPLQDIAESDLERQHYRGFMHTFWMNRLLGPSACRRFILTGARYRVAKFGARALSRFTGSWIERFQSCIKGHTITAVYRKPG